jgi:cation diffusion facilitator CzcD-associated flavoprotein CzcO
MGSIEEPPAASLDYDVLIVGAGLSGIFSLYRMRQLGLRARVLEAGSGEGGTWYWLVCQSRYGGFGACTDRMKESISRVSI